MKLIDYFKDALKHRDFANRKMKDLFVFEEGDLEHGIWSAGISVARVKDVPTCKEMVERLVSEAEEIIDGRLQSVKA